MGLGGNRSAGWQTLLDTVPLACRALKGKTYTWEYGNEPDLFSTSAQGPVRPPTWNESTYVEQWLNATRHIRESVRKNCHGTASPRFMAPSNAGVSNHLKATKMWPAGLNQDNDIELFSTHKCVPKPLQVSAGPSLTRYTATSAARHPRASRFRARS